MKVLVLGASGHIGKRLAETLTAAPGIAVVRASRNEQALLAATPSVKVNTLDQAALTATLKGFDAVVNCVAGNAEAISSGAQVLAQAALAAQCPRIVHFSTMSVYGPAEGLVFENAPLDPGLGWYGKAKCEAEQHVAEFARQGGEAVVLRPGCVFGPGSALWVSRIGQWLQAGRLGDLGVAGDGWSNLVDVGDVCQAALAALYVQLGATRLARFNIAAPDSPRWNTYFIDLALALNATPVRRISSHQLRMDSLLGGPPLKVAEIALKRLGKSAPLPAPMPPGLVRLWSQHIRLDVQAATQQLDMVWTPYANALSASSEWFSRRAHGGA